MKLNEHFVRHVIDGQTVVVPTAGAGFHGLIQGNQSVAVILECLEHETTEEEIAAVMCSRFSGDPAVIREDVADVIAQLRSIGAIDG